MKYGISKWANSVFWGQNKPGSRGFSETRFRLHSIFFAIERLLNISTCLQIEFSRLVLIIATLCSTPDFWAFIEPWVLKYGIRKLHFCETPRNFVKVDETMNILQVARTEPVSQQLVQLAEQASEDLPGVGARCSPRGVVTLFCFSCFFELWSVHG